MRRITLRAPEARQLWETGRVEVRRAFNAAMSARLAEMKAQIGVKP